MAKLIHLRITCDPAHVPEGRAACVCWASGDALGYGEALPILADGHPPGAAINEEEAMWGTWTTEAEHVTCPACLRILGRGTKTDG